MRKGSCSPHGRRSPTGCSSSASGICGQSWPSTRPTTTDGGLTAAASSGLPGPTILSPTSARSRSRAGPSSAASSTNTSGPHRSQGQDRWPTSRTPQVSSVVCRQIVQDVDHRNLNTDVPWLEGRTPTAENLALALGQVGFVGDSRPSTACMRPISACILASTCGRRHHHDAAHRIVGHRHVRARDACGYRRFLTRPAASKRRPERAYGRHAGVGSSFAIGALSCFCEVRVE